MKILLTGGSGFVGSCLVLDLIASGHELVFLSRNPASLKERYGDMCTYVIWDALSGPPPKDAFDGVEAIINLMGEGVADKRWNDKRKKVIRDTRVLGTQYLLEGADRYAKSLRVLVSTSAIGVYNHTQPKPITEASNPASDFLGRLCQDWEAAAESFGLKKSIRTVIIRVGIVVGQGGALAKMRMPFLLGAGGKLGSGMQWMNWIHINDLSAIFVRVVENEQYHGAYNAVSPNNVTNKMFTHALGRVLHRPTLFSVPAVVIKLLLGEMAQEVLRGQKVVPERLINDRFKFSYPHIEPALEHALNIKYMDHLGKKVRCLRFHVGQFLPYPKEDVFRFFSDAKNLERITPPFLRFHIASQSTENIQEGTLFDYNLKVHGIPLRWRTLICDWQAPDVFVDTQLKGPYRVWHHTHRFTSYKNGTWIEDEVYFALPNIPFSGLAIPFVKKDVSAIFDYRKQSIADIMASR